MANPLSQLKNLNELRKQAKKMQNDLAREEIRVEEGDIVVVITGDQKVKHFSVQGVSSEDAVSVINKAIQKSQQVAAKKLQEQYGGLTGMMGQMG
ncbi:MAG: hypothetical protein GF381_01135 [Candidatus Pacebacteria bacterium]|nr:hypothetical protein [Candidatus Paceibacterota bacterium]